MKKWYFLILVVAFLLPIQAVAGTVDFTITTNLSNEPPVCSATVTTNCALGTRLYYMNGANVVNVATTPFLTTASGTTVQSLPGTVIKSYATNLVFSAVVQGKDLNGALIESNPTSAAPVSLKPGAVISLTVSQ